MATWPAKIATAVSTMSSGDTWPTRPKPTPVKPATDIALYLNLGTAEASGQTTVTQFKGHHQQA